MRAPGGPGPAPSLGPAPRPEAPVAGFNHCILRGLSTSVLAVSQKCRITLTLQVEKATLVKTALVWKAFIPTQLCLLFFQDATHASPSTRHTRRFWIGWPKPVKRAGREVICLESQDKKMRLTHTHDLICHFKKMGKVLYRE